MHALGYVRAVGAQQHQRADCEGDALAPERMAQRSDESWIGALCQPRIGPFEKARGVGFSAARPAP